MNIKSQEIETLKGLLIDAQQAIQTECEDFGLFMTTENFRANMDSYQSGLFKRQCVEVCHDDSSHKKAKMDPAMLPPAP